MVVEVVIEDELLGWKANPRVVYSLHICAGIPRNMGFPRFAKPMNLEVDIGIFDDDHGGVDAASQYFWGLLDSLDLGVPYSPTGAADHDSAK